MGLNILFVCVEIPQPVTKKDLETEFPGMILSKIENSLVGEITNNKLIFVSSFGVITFCNFAQDEIASFLSRLNIKEAEHYKTALINQDYPMIVHQDFQKPIIDNYTIKYDKFDKSTASIIALALSQSVGLELRERTLEMKMGESKDLYSKIEELRIKDRGTITKFASSIAKERFEILNQLYLLDKPDILWDNVELESLYNQLSLQLELKSRFDVIEYKISYLKESVDFARDMINQRSSEFLEWIIIWLIVIEIILSIYSFIKDILY
jgi:required for meiotic nuclear division protein 1